MLPDLTLSWTSSPFRRSLSLFLAHPLKSTHIHTDTTPLLRQQVKQNNSLCHTIAPLPRSRHWLLYSMTFFFFFPSLLCSLPPHWFGIFSYHRNSATTRASDGELLDLSHCVAVLCCVVRVDLVQPIHQERFVIVDTFVWWELEVLCVYYKPLYWHLSALDLFKFAAMRQHFSFQGSPLALWRLTLYKTQHWTGKKAFIKTQFYCTKCFIVFTKYI